MSCLETPASISILVQLWPSLFPAGRRPECQCSPCGGALQALGGDVCVRLKAGHWSIPRWSICLLMSFGSALISSLSKKTGRCGPRFCDSLVCSSLGRQCSCFLTFAWESGLLHSSIREKFKCVAPHPCRPPPHREKGSTALAVLWKQHPYSWKPDRSTVPVKCLRDCETDVTDAFHV